METNQLTAQLILLVKKHNLIQASVEGFNNAFHYYKEEDPEEFCKNFKSISDPQVSLIDPAVYWYARVWPELDHVRASYETGSRSTVPPPSPVALT